MPKDNDVDLILHGGDFYDQIRSKSHLWTCPRDTNDLGGLRQYCDDLKESKTPFYAVRGNHDVKDPAGFFEEADVTGKIVEISEGLFLVGLSWHGDDYFDIPDAATMSECCAKLLDECVKVMKDGDQSILLSHYVASGKVVQDPGWVFDCIMDVARALRPIIVLQGHSHKLFGLRWEHEDIQFALPGTTGMTFELDPALNLEFLG
jgi:Icc-related predicted phosphoesterase